MITTKSKTEIAEVFGVSTRAVTNLKKQDIEGKGHELTKRVQGLLRALARPKMMRLIIIIVAGSCLVGVARAQPDKVLYELQERCGNRAAEVFQKEWGGHILNITDGYITADYENHYSPRLNRCFYLQKSNSFSTLKTGGTISTQSLTLYDLNENKQFGSFETGGLGGISECQVQGKNCRSEQEWRELARPFLEE